MIMFRNTLAIVFFFLLAVAAKEEPDRCIDWEIVARDFDHVYANWKAPSSYSFTIKSCGANPGPQVKRTVKPGKKLRQGPYRGLQTMDDIWNLIKTQCIQGCPTKGAHFCTISYRKDPKTGLVYPSHVIIDPTEKDNDGLNYRIRDFCVQGEK